MWLGQMLGQAGLRMFQIAALWWIVVSPVADSGKQLAIFMVISALPSLVFVKLIGKTIDTQRTRRILLVSDAAAWAALLICAFLLNNSILCFPGAVFMGFLVALAEAFLDPCFNKAVKEVVEPEDVENAVAFQSSTQSIANFTGAVAGAMLIDFLGIAKIFLLSSSAYLLAGIINYFVRFKRTSVQGESETATDLSGWKILESLPLIKRVLIGFGFVNFFVTPTLVVLPLYTNKTLKATASVLGQLEASLWIGLIAGTFLSNRFKIGRENFAGGAIRLGAVCIFITGISLIVPGIIADKFVYMAALFLTGGSIGVNNVKFITLFQETVDPAVKGRFFALMQAMIGFTFPVAYFIFGFLADYASPPNLCLIQGLGSLVLAGYFMRLARSSNL